MRCSRAGARAAAVPSGTHPLGRYAAICQRLRPVQSASCAAPCSGSSELRPRLASRTRPSASCRPASGGSRRAAAGAALEKRTQVDACWTLEESVPDFAHRAWPEGGAARQESSLFQPQNPPGEDLTRAVSARPSRSHKEVDSGRKPCPLAQPPAHTRPVTSGKQTRVMVTDLKPRCLAGSEGSTMTFLGPGGLG